MGKRASVSIEGQRIEDAVIVFIDGRQYTAWKSVSISRSLTNLSGGFSISVYHRWQEDGQEWEITPGKPVQVQVGSERIITGFIDSVNVSADSNSRTYSFSGRDRTADLIDCSVTNKFEFKSSIKLEELARQLIAPFSGINIVVQAETGAAIKDLTVQQGETVADVLQREAQKKGLIVTSDEFGRVVFTRPGNTKNSTAIVQGFNMLRASASYDNSSRYSEYLIKGNAPATDDYFGIQNSQPKATSRDSGIDRFRPLLIISEGNVDNGQAQERANWEATVRAAKSAQVQVTVLGWFNGANQLWKPNQLVRIQSGMLGLNQEMLIESVSYSKDESGTLTTMGLVRPDAYKQGPVLPQKDPLLFLRGFKAEGLEK